MNLIDYYDYKHNASQLFGADRGGRTHQGLDFANNSPVPALVSGTVISAIADPGKSNPNYGFGNRIVTQTNQGLIGYSHLRDRPAFKIGDKIAVGQIVGHEGRSGWVEGICMHLDQQVNGRYINPLPLVQSVIKYANVVINEEDDMAIVNIQGKEKVRAGGAYEVVGNTARFLGAPAKDAPSLDFAAGTEFLKNKTILN